MGRLSPCSTCIAMCWRPVCVRVKRISTTAPSSTRSRAGELRALRFGKPLGTISAWSALVPTRADASTTKRKHKRKKVGMGKISSAVAGVMILLAAPQAVGRAEQSARVPVVGDYGRWGFDLTGMDRSIKPGDDFYRYANGAWYDRTRIPPDRDSNGVDRV